MPHNCFTETQWSKEASQSKTVLVSLTVILRSLIMNIEGNNWLVFQKSYTVFIRGKILIGSLESIIIMRALKKQIQIPSPSRNYLYNTLGGFIQNTLDFNPKLTLESGLRTDYSFEYGLFILPRIIIASKSQ